MIILTPLVFDNLSDNNKKSFNIDTDIVRGLHSDEEICSKYLLTISQLSGRKTSLVRRGNFVKNLPYVKVTTKASAKPKVVAKSLPLGANTRLRNKVVSAIMDKDAVQKIADDLDVSLSTITRLKRLITSGVISVNDDFSNSDGVKKEEARATMENAIAKSGLYGKILTLPYKYCKIELRLIANVSNRFSFVGCETEPKVYFEMLKTVADNRINMECSPRPIIEKIEVAHENEYSHLLLDYCGQLNSFKDDIETAMRNDIVKVGGTISITLNKRKTKVGGIEDEMNDLNPLGNIKGKEVENAILTFIRIVGGFKYSIETVMPYKDKGKGSMILVVVKRLK